jgi:hypothetical protein
MFRAQYRFGAVVACLAIAAACSESDPPAGPSTPAVPSTPRVVTVEVTAGAGSLSGRGQTQQMIARVTLSNGFTEDRTASAQWQSNNTGVAAVSASGLVTAGNEGDATITATTDGESGGLGVRVRYAVRTPDPAPGQRLPAPNESGFVAQIMRERPDLLARSCQDAGGTWELMDLIVDRLREKDTRWGYNGRRGDPNFVARDEVAYHWGAGPDLLSRDSYSFDVIAGHCGPTPSATWFDVTDLGTIWVNRGRF